MTFDRGICVCGLGRLGAPIAAVFAASSVPVIGLDIDAGKVRNINERRAPVAEPDLQSYLELDEVVNNLRATIDVPLAVESSDATIFVTPTPSATDGSFDYRLLTMAVKLIARAVAARHRRGYLFIISSTVAPGTMDGIIKPILEQHLSGLRPRLAYKPEFIALGTVICDLHYPAVTLIGEDREETGAAVESLYSRMTIGTATVKRMRLVEAELAKISLNCAVTAKISFANQVGLVAAALGADPSRVLDAVGADPRVGPAQLRSGLPFGGPCFPRDNRMFRHTAERLGVRAPMAEATDMVNKLVLETVLTRVVKRHGPVGILGLAYKPGTPVVDDSPGRWWQRALAQRQRTVFAHDPVAPHPNELEEVLACPTVIVATAWPEYKKLRLQTTTELVDPYGVVEDVEFFEGERQTSTMSLKSRCSEARVTA